MQEALMVLDIPKKNQIEMNLVITRKQFAQMINLIEDGEKKHIIKLGKIVHVGSAKSEYWKIN